MTRSSSNRQQPPDLVGRQVARRYRIERALGKGRVGTVYRADDRTERRPVALKIYRPDVVPGAPDTEAMIADMAAATRLAHASIVPVFDVGTHAKKYLYTVEPLLAGRSVGKRLGEGGPLEPDLVARIGTELAAALHVLHRSNLLHLDLTPENVFLVQDPLGMERVALTAPGGRHILGLENAPHEEGEGCLAGPAYLAPELVFGKPPEHTTDIYLLGSLLYELLVGQPPCRGNDFASAARKHVVEKPTPPTEARPDAGIPRALELLIMRCLEKSADKRPPSMKKVMWALEELLGRDSPSPEVHFVQGTSTSPPPAILDWAAPLDDPAADSTEFNPKDEDGGLDELAAAVEVAAFRQRVGWSTPPPQAKPELVEAEPSEPPPLPEDVFDGELKASDPPPSDPTLREALQAAREESLSGLTLAQLNAEAVPRRPPPSAPPLPAAASRPPASAPPPPIPAEAEAERPRTRTGKPVPPPPARPFSLFKRPSLTDATRSSPPTAQAAGEPDPADSAELLPPEPAEPEILDAELEATEPEPEAVEPTAQAPEPAEVAEPEAEEPEPQTAEPDSNPAAESEAPENMAPKASEPVETEASARVAQAPEIEQDAAEAAPDPEAHEPVEEEEDASAAGVPEPPEDAPVSRAPRPSQAPWVEVKRTPLPDAAEAEPTPAPDPRPALVTPAKPAPALAAQQTPNPVNGELRDPDISDEWDRPSSGPPAGLWVAIGLAAAAIVGFLFLRADDEPDPAPPPVATAAAEDPAPAKPKRDQVGALRAIAQGEKHLAGARWDQAAAAFTEAVQLDPDNAAAHDGRAAAEFQREDFRAAANHGARAVELSPNNADYRLRVGMAHFKMKEYDAANAAWKAVLDTDPANATAKRYLSLLDRRRKN